MLALPTNRDENWRYANLRPLAQAKADALARAPLPAISLPPPLPGHERWVFVDGVFEASLSTTVSARLVSEASANRMLDGELAHAGVDFAFARANTAHGDHVLVLDGVDGLNLAVELICVATQPASQGTSYPRVQLHAQRNSTVSLVERHLSVGSVASAINMAVDIGVSPGATVNHVRIQDYADTAVAIDTLIATVAEQGQYRLRAVTLGALASRSTLFIKLAGRGARCDFVAASIATGTQTHDTFAEIDHAAPATVTREVFRGIASGRGKLAFNGKMIVRRHAHDADSDQSLKSLLTGTGAEAAARPQLEIYTDRVRAKHGATTGKLDEQMLFYLLSRGIDRPTAQGLLQWAFVEDAISRIESADLRRAVEKRIAARLTDVAVLPDLLGEHA